MFGSVVRDARGINAVAQVYLDQRCAARVSNECAAVHRLSANCADPMTSDARQAEMAQAMISGCGSCCVLQIGEKRIHSGAAL